jgi:hypothetical protein
MNRKQLLPLLLLLYLPACVSLDQVRTFSKNACGILSSINDLDYSFKASYIKYTLPGKDFDLSLKEPTPDTAALRLFGQADATIAMFSNALLAYFSGLGQLADPSTGSTDYSKLGDAIKGNEKVLSKLHITGDQVEAGVSLAHKITDALTRHYKEEKIKEVILEDTAAVRKVVEALSAGLSELQNNIVSDQGQLKAKYFLVTADPDIDKGARILFAREYQKEVTELEEKKHAIAAQKRGLEVLYRGHQDIADRLRDNKLSAGQILSLLEQYSADLQTIYNDIKKLAK